MDTFIIIPKDENLEVIIRHNLIISQVNAMKNFQDYLQFLTKEFEKEYTRTVHQIVACKEVPKLILP